MAAAFQVSKAELSRVYTAAYEGKVIRFCLSSNTSLTVDSTTAQWDAVELASSNGYARVVITIPSATYDNTIGMQKSSELTATFTGASSGFSFSRVYGVIGTVSGGVTTWNTNISYLFVESTPISLAAGISQPYKVYLLTDDKTTSPI